MESNKYDKDVNQDILSVVNRFDQRHEFPKNDRFPSTVVFFLSFLSGSILCLTAYPHDLWWISWIGLIPFCVALSERSNSFFSHASIAIGMLPWMLGLAEFIAWQDYHFHLWRWIILGLFGLLPWFALSLVSFPVFENSILPRPLAFACLWCAAEYVGSFVCQRVVGFQYISIGFTQVAGSPLLQLADISGEHGISFIIATLNQVFADFILWAMGRIRPRSVMKTVFMATILSAIVLIWATIRTSQSYQCINVRIAIVPNLLPNDKKSVILQWLERNSEWIDLVVWPETSLETGWYEGISTAADPSIAVAQEESVKSILLACKAANSPMIVGTSLCRPESGRLARFNVAIAFSRTGDVISLVEKHQLVPFHEHFTGRWIAQVFSSGRSEWPGFWFGGGPKFLDLMTNTRFGSLRIGLPICSEIGCPETFRRSVVADGERYANVVIGIGREGMFPRGPAQHYSLMLSRLRAIENRVPVVRCTFGGDSCVIDEDGKILRILGRPTIDQPAMIVDLPTMTKRSMYRTVGPWLQYGCIGYVLILTSFSVFSRR
ncbi:apolipoprotein N-acyltransferase [bacterium]|nr:apolipoprotein N-acyltransferase [bacterium]